MAPLSDNRPRWHRQLGTTVEHPWGTLSGEDGPDDPRQTPEFAALDRELFDAESADDEQAAARIVEQQLELLSGERAREDAVSAAAAGLAEWPADVIWSQSGGPRTWPAYVANSGVDFVDSAAQQELERLLPAGSFATAPARLRNLVGESIDTHRLLVVTETVDTETWHGPVKGSRRSKSRVAVPDSSSEEAPVLARRAQGSGPPFGLLASGAATELLAASPVLGLKWDPLAWVSEFQGQSGWERKLK